MRKLRIILWALVALALIALAVLLLRGPERPQASESMTIASIGGPFTLTGSDGNPFPSSRLGGKPHAIFFGFTNCPDVCPTTLSRLARLRDRLDAGERPFEILFITVDPERDGPAEVGKYSDLFDSPIIGLTGSPAQIEQVKKQFGIYSRKVPGHHGSDYSVDHTSTVLLFDGSGDFVATISPEEPDTMALDKLRRITA